MDNESQSIVEQSDAAAGNSATDNGVDTNDWYAARKEKGADSAHRKLAKAGAQETTPTTIVPESKPDTKTEVPPLADPKAETKPEAKPELTPLEKANHAWEAKYGKESGKRKRAEEMAAAATQQAETYRQRAQQLTEQLKAYQAAPPQREGYTTEGDYIRAIGEHSAEVRMAQRDLQGLEHNYQGTVQEATTVAMEAKIIDAVERIPDWHATVEGAKGVQMRTEVLDEIRKSDVVAEVAYYLAKNPAEAHKLNSFTDKSQFDRYLARVEFRAEQEYGPNAKPAVTAPAAPVVQQQVQQHQQLRPTAPTTSVVGAAPASVNNMSMDDYAAKRRKGQWA